MVPPQLMRVPALFLLTPLREGRLEGIPVFSERGTFLLTPLREGRQMNHFRFHSVQDFYSRPCGRGDYMSKVFDDTYSKISTHAPAGGATGRV